MRTQKCNQCGAILDITQLEKGSKFACSSCGQVLVVGEAVAVRKSLQESGPAFKPRGNKAAAAPTSRSRTRTETPARRERPARGAPPPKKSPVPLIVGIAAVAVSGIILAVTMGGGKDGDGSSAKTAEKPKLSPREWWAQNTLNADSTMRDLGPREIERILAEAKSHGYDQDPSFWAEKKKKLSSLLLKKDPRNEKANRGSGRKSIRDYPNFPKVWKRLQEEPWLPDRFEDLRNEYFDKLGSHKHLWMNQKEFETFKGAFDDYQGWRKKVDADPVELEVEKAVARVRRHVILKNYGAVALKVPPFIIFFSSRELIAADDSPEEAERVAEKRKKLLAHAETYRPLYEAFYENFERRYRKPLNLPKPKANQFIFQWIFEDREGFNKYNEKDSGRRLPPTVLGYFSPRNHWVFIYERDASRASGISNMNTMAHEATHQLHWHFAKDPSDSAQNYMDEGRSVWFQEGWAEFLGGSSRKNPETGKIEFSWYALGRAHNMRQMKARGLPLMPIRELAKLESYEDFNRWFRNYWNAEARRQMRENGYEENENRVSQGTYFAALYAQSWLFVHFLNEYKSGKYRKLFLDMVMTMLRGRKKPAAYRQPGGKERWTTALDAFESIFGIKSQADWDRLQKEYDEFLEEVLEKAPKPEERGGGEEEGCGCGDSEDSTLED